MSLLFPIAASCDAALAAPMGHGARPREAAAIAGGEVHFVSEPWGPSFTTREAAVTANAAALAHAWCALRPVLAQGAPAPKPARPVNRDGARWPASVAPGVTHWRLCVSYWRTGPLDIADPLPAARRARRDPTAAQRLDGAMLGRLAEQPLRPFRPQQPLDVGLFETRLPESPNIVVADD